MTVLLADTSFDVRESAETALKLGKAEVARALAELLAVAR